MPYCAHCGNNQSLASTIFPPGSDTAAAPPYGLVGNFDQDGCITTMECQGASLDDAQEAFEEPEKYFNLWPVCGSKDIRW